MWLKSSRGFFHLRVEHARLVREAQLVIGSTKKFAPIRHLCNFTILSIDNQVDDILCGIIVEHRDTMWPFDVSGMYTEGMNIYWRP
jgi:uncharacterized membrane protein